MDVGGRERWAAGSRAQHHVYKHTVARVRRLGDARLRHRLLRGGPHGSSDVHGAGSPPPGPWAKETRDKAGFLA